MKTDRHAVYAMLLITVLLFYSMSIIPASNCPLLGIQFWVSCSVTQEAYRPLCTQNVGPLPLDTLHPPGQGRESVWLGHPPSSLSGPEAGLGQGRGGPGEGARGWSHLAGCVRPPPLGPAAGRDSCRASLRSRGRQREAAAAPAAPG